MLKGMNEAVLSMANGKPDLADHFVACSKVGRYLTVFDESRFIITDDFRDSKVIDRTAASIASIFSRDPLVAEAALLPLGKAAADPAHDRHVYEELFTLIERQTLAPAVKESAESMLQADFREARIREIEATLRGKIDPARERYRSFLGIIRKLTEQNITPSLFRDEFLEFTYDVAGRLDFGIYSYCLDRIFGNQLIAMKAKGYLVSELLGFPPTIRRELLTNLLTAPGAEKRLTDFVRDAIEQKLDRVASTEIGLLAALKSSEMSIDEINQMVAETA